jgi:hypothetical protein
MCTQPKGPMGKCKALETALNNKLLSSHEHLKKGVFSPPPPVQQCLLRGAAAWAIGRVGQKPSDAFNGSAAQQLLRVESNSDAASADDSTELDGQGIEGRDLRWWLRSWQH